MSAFNIRVYGILTHHGKILLIEEPYAGQTLIKFPGGGLNFGEGLTEALKREFLEELNLRIVIENHFYTLDFFQPSAFHADEQLLAVYYKVHAPDPDQLKILDPKIRRLLHIPLEQLNEELLSLPVDKKVAALLRQKRSVP